MSGCDNSNPQKGNNEKSQTASTSEKSSAKIPKYVDKDYLANRSYELRFLLVQQKFNSPDDISVNALVQYALCHMYYENLVEMPNEDLKMRQTSVDNVNAVIEKHFGKVNTDITTSDLYNKSKNCFEMWEPAYGRKIYYDVSVSNSGKNTYKASTTFYKNSKKKTVIGKTILTVKYVDESPIIVRMTSSN